MKKLISLAGAALMLLSLAACGSDSGSTSSSSAKATLTCGITDFEPMNYKDENGKWIGFDTEFAELVAEKLGMNVKFQEIEWGQKYQELRSGAISCIWNGFTANSTDENDSGVEVERNTLVDFSYSYMLNQQCVVIKKSNAASYKTAADLKNKKVVAESGSAGETTAKEVADKVNGIPSQAATFNEVKSGAADCAVVDILLAKRLTSSGDFSDLMIADIEMESEIYAVGFKKGDELRDKVNAAIKELANDGKLNALANKYNLGNLFELNYEFK